MLVGISTVAGLAGLFRIASGGSGGDIRVRLFALCGRLESDQGLAVPWGHR